MARFLKALAATFALFVWTASPAAGLSDYGCPDAKILGARLLDGICWDCLFPWRIMGNFSAGGGSAPSKATQQVLCNCNDAHGVPNPGYTSGLWNPARMIEVVRNPWCTPTLGGRKLMDTYRLVGNAHRSPLNSVFMNVHYIAFPVMQFMELLGSKQCNPEGFIDLDLISMSEVDPSHNDSELDFLTNPFGAAFAGLENFAAGAAACVAETAGVETDELFWWSGCIGPLFPMTGHAMSGGSAARSTTLIASRYLTKMHLLGLARKTMGDSSMCHGSIFPMIPKSQYKFSRVFPWGESSAPCCHTMGASTYSWGGEYRNIPGISDYVYMLWRWTDCCMN